MLEAKIKKARVPDVYSAALRVPEYDERVHQSVYFSIGSRFRRSTINAADRPEPGIESEVLWKLGIKEVDLDTVASQTLPRSHIFAIGARE